MAGIVSCGVYIPWWRANGNVISGLRGEKAMAHFDEDSVTMAVAAACNCVAGVERRQIDGLFFASTTSPYKEKPASVIVATATDLRSDIRTADFTNSLRAGTTAIKSALDAIRSGSAKQVLVVAADCRTGAPGSEFELTCGDGAAALLIGDSSVAVELEAEFSTAEEIFDIWRSDRDAYIRGWEGRFIWEVGTSEAVQQTVSGLLRQCGLSPQDIGRVVFYGPEPRRYGELARLIGASPKAAVQDSISPAIGDVGVAHPLLLLITALAEAQPGERILLASYSNGCDAFIMRATEAIQSVDNGQLRKYIESKRMVPSYGAYLQWRGITEAKMFRPGLGGELSASVLWREQSEYLRFCGSKCKVCGLVDHPPQRVCARCKSKDQFELVRLAEKQGKVFTYCMDYVLSELDIPNVIAVVDFGERPEEGRVIASVTDRDVAQMRVELPVEMTFRRYFYEAGIHDYCWKAMPRRFD